MTLRMASFLTLWLTAPLVAQAPPTDLFAPDQVLRIEVKLAPQDWHAVRISHPKMGEDWLSPSRPTITIAPTSPSMVCPSSRLVVRKKGLFSAVSTRPWLRDQVR